MENALLSSRPDILPFSRPPTPRPQPPQIGYYGLGAMGYVMARNLALSVKSQDTASPPLLVYNRTAAKAERLVQDAGNSVVQVASSPAQLATKCDIIFTNLANDVVVIAVYNEFVKALKQDLPTKRKIFVDFSTIYPGVAGDIDKLLSGIPHCHFVASPVIGPPTAAADGKLVVLMSGDYAAKKEVAYLLVPGVGRKVIDVGGNAEKAHTLKLLGNMMLTGANELLAEVQTLGQKSGVGARIVQDLIKDIMPAPSLLIFGEKMVNDRFGEVGYDLDGCIEVTNHMRRLSAEHSCPMPVVDIAHQRLVTARSIHEAQKIVGTNKWETMDWSAMIAGSRVAAGLEPFNCSQGTKVVHDD
ncbi:NAD(P)-binding protein [Gyrodon lividus]|nr:NAD(P)-binding protein [Gyrodon lividus]